MTRCGLQRSGEPGSGERRMIRHPFFRCASFKRMTTRRLRRRRCAIELPARHGRSAVRIASTGAGSQRARFGRRRRRGNPKSLFRLCAEWHKLRLDQVALLRDCAVFRINVCREWIVDMRMPLRDRLLRAFTDFINEASRGYSECDLECEIFSTQFRVRPRNAVPLADESDVRPSPSEQQRGFP